MFGKIMKNYYYGKSGKGDFRKEDMPETRWQLFWDTLRTRLSGLCRLNLIYMLIWLPTIIVLGFSFINGIQNLNYILAAKDGTLTEFIQATSQENETVTITDEQQQQLADVDIGQMLESSLFTTLLILIPCIAVTGPFTAGISFVTRNWARDEHAFMWSDFKDAVKQNWKQGLAISSITSVLPLIVYVCWRFYGNLAGKQMIMIIPQVLVVILAVLWSISVTYMHPMEVTYDLKLSGVLRNGFLLGIARLPMSIGIRLLHCVPCAIGALLCYFWNPFYAVLILGGYYVLIGFGLSRFITASYTNAVFDKYINPRIEGADVNKGLKARDIDDDDTEDAVE